MQVQTTPLEDVYILTPDRHGDARGFFSESWNASRMAAAGFDIAWVQDNHSFSTELGTLRGLHCQRPPRAQAKLVRCGRGALLDVVVDIRIGSPSYGKWISQELSFENGRQLLMPEGCLHGFVTRAPETEIIYKCSDVYAPDLDVSIHYASFGINWGLANAPILSPKDANAQAFDAFDNPFTYEGKK